MANSNNCGDNGFLFILFGGGGTMTLLEILTECITNLILFIAI